MAHRARGGQLSLDMEPSVRSASLPRLAAMTASAGAVPFDDPEWFFEPWWPGTPALAYLDDGWVRLQVEHLADPNLAFPELAGIGASFHDDRLIVQGTLLVLDDDGRPDADLLRGRLAGDGPRSGVASFVASDLLNVGGRSLLELPFEDRRARLARQLTDGDACVISRGLRGEGTTLAQAVASMGLAEISARRLDARYRPGQASDAWLRLPVSAPPAPQTRPLLALLQRLPL
jgi:bifunctional non-homologous end joining protein LigD